MKGGPKTKGSFIENTKKKCCIFLIPRYIFSFVLKFGKLWNVSEWRSKLACSLYFHQTCGLDQGYRLSIQTLDILAEFMYIKVLRGLGFLAKILGSNLSIKIL